MNVDLNGIAGLITAISLLAGSQGVVAWVGRRQLRSDVGDTGDSTLVDRFDRLEVRMSNIENRLDTIAPNGNGPH